MLQSIENNAGIIGEDLALLCNYDMCAKYITIHHVAIQRQALIFVCNVQVYIII